MFKALCSRVRYRTEVQDRIVIRTYGVPMQIHVFVEPDIDAGRIRRFQIGGSWADIIKGTRASFNCDITQHKSEAENTDGPEYARRRAPACHLHNW